MTRLIHCRYCGAKLVRDLVGWKCPTHNCQWQHGAPDQDVYYDTEAPQGG